MSNSRIALCWFLAVALLFVPPTWLGTDFIFGLKDGIFYTVVLNLTGSAMANGELYPRWFAAANAGQGSPVMIFYSPLAYTLTSVLFGWLAAFDPLTHARFLLGIAASQFLCGLTAYFWLKHHFSKPMALAGSLAYILFPYKLMQLWLHANLAQSWAMVWLPLWMLAAERMAAGSRKAILAYALCFALVAYSHLLSIIAFAAVPALYYLFFATQTWARRFSTVALANLLGIMLTLAYVLPMQLNKPLIALHEFVGGYYTSITNLSHVDTLLCLYYFVPIALGLGLLAVISSTKKRPTHFYFFSGITMALWFMTTPASAPLWVILPLLDYIQFPMARFHVGISVAGAWLVPYAWQQWSHALPNLGPMRTLLYAPSTTFVAMMIGTWFCIGQLLAAYHCYFLVGGHDLKVMHHWNVILPKEYITVWSQPEVVSPAAMQQARQTPLVSVKLGDASITSASQHSNRNITLQAEVHSSEATLLLRQFYFTGWNARLQNGEPVALEPDGVDGWMRLTLPQGSHRVTLRLEDLLGEHSGRLLSLMTLAGMGLFWLTQKRGKTHFLSSYFNRLN